jgi:putative hydrolase of HD superfamily
VTGGDPADEGGADERDRGGEDGQDRGDQNGYDRGGGSDTGETSPDEGGAGNDADEPSSGALAALVESYGLKDERRTGWQLSGIDDPESVAAHSWGVSLLCLAFADEAGVDPDRALRLAVVHDLAEARTGDLPTRADPADEPIPSPEKERRERAAMSELGAPFPVVAEAWEAYERRDTPEARFVKDIDLVDMCLQALVYEREGRYDPETAFENETGSEYDHLDEFFATAEPRLSTDVGRRLFDRLHGRYERVRDGRDERDTETDGGTTADGGATADGDVTDGVDDEPTEL